MRILVTGLRGFTGKYVKIALEEQGHEVITLKSNLEDAQEITNEIKGTSFNAVIHLAAIAFVGHGNINDIYQVNLLGTRNLLQALTQTVKPISHILITSSANIYGNSSAEILNEQTVANPANDYALSKYAMELMAGFWSDHLPITLLRPFNYTGVGQSNNFLIPKIVEHFKLKKSHIELGNLEVCREFNDVRFIANTYSQLVVSPPKISGQAVNICTGKAYSLHEVIQLCETITGHTLDIQINPKFVRVNEVRILKGDNARLQTMIKPSLHYHLNETLTWMLS